MSGDVDGRGGLNLKHIQSIKVIVPPMSEQMKFVSIARQADKSKFGWRIDEVGWFLHNSSFGTDIRNVAARFSAWADAGWLIIKVDEIEVVVALYVA